MQNNFVKKIGYNILNQLPAGVLLCQMDEFFTVSGVNDEFENMFGYSLDGIAKRFKGSFMKMIHPVDRPRVIDMSQKAETSSLSFRCRIMSRECTYWWIMMNIKQIRGVYSDDDTCLLCTLTHVHESQIPTGIRQIPAYLQLNSDQTSDIVFEWDMANDKISYSENWISKFGYEPIQHDVSTLLLHSPHIHKDDLGILESLIDNVKNGTRYCIAELRIRDVHQTDIWYRLRVTNQYDEHGNAVKAVGILSDINDEKTVLDDLRRRAERDALTGLYNREETELQIRSYLQNHPNEKSALLMIDTDNFKAVNDTQGHLFGDAVLCEMASGMRRITRESDVVGRIGGDEFTIFLKNISSIQAVEEKAAKMLHMFQHMFQGEKKSIEITCSVGVAFYPKDGTDYTTLYNHADIALYQAKNQGKNQFCLYQTDMQPLSDSSTIGTHIDSNQNSTGMPDDLVNYVFRVLFDTRDIDHAIQLILEIVGKRFDVSRAYIFENSEDNNYVDNTYEWCNEGILPQKDNLQHFPYEVVAGYKELFTDNSIFYCRDIYALTPDKIALFESQDICSTLQCAIREDDEFRGFVGFDECTGMRLWTKEEIGILSLISQVLTTFLQKKCKDSKENRLSIKLNTILDVQNACIYAIEKNSYDILYMNHQMKELESTSFHRQKCYQLFFDRTSPCEHCPMGKGSCEVYNSKYNVWVKAQAAPIQWGDQNAWLLSCYDITEYKKLQGDALEK